MVTYWESLCKSKRPKCKSYEVLVSHYKDKLMLAKFTFLKKIANRLKGYLIPFQTDNPMVPFLSDTLEGMLRKLMNDFIRKEVLREASNARKLIKVDVEKKENRLPVDMLNHGTAVKAILRSSDITEGAKHQFRKDCIVLLTKLIQKLQERSPLNYLIVRCSSSLSPVNMVQNQEKAVNHFGVLVERLHRYEWVSATIADSAKDEFEDFVKSIDATIREEFKHFDFLKCRVDEFLSPHLNKNEKFSAFWKICKLIFTLSHSQCAVERGFSVNKELLVENLEETSLISQRITYDHVQTSKQDLHQFHISQGLIKSCKLARSRYSQHLEDQKSIVAAGRKAEKRKIIREEVDDIKKRKVKLNACINSLNADIEKLSYQAEESNNLEFLVRANAFRRKVSEKKNTIQDLDKAIEKLQDDLHKESNSIV